MGDRWRDAAISIGYNICMFCSDWGGGAFDVLRNERGCQLKSLRGVTLGGG